MSEFENGDTVRIHHDYSWKNGVYVGKNPMTGADSHHVVICDGRFMSVARIAIKPQAKKEIRVKGLVDLMKTLVDGGYEPNVYGDFCADDKFIWDNRFWGYCGKLPNPDWEYEPEWLEEVEI